MVPLQQAYVVGNFQETQLTHVQPGQTVQAVPGSGLGLAIVADLVGLYGGELQLDDAALSASGLRVGVRLPAGD